MPQTLSPPRPSPAADAPAARRAAASGVEAIDEVAALESTPMSTVSPQLWLAFTAFAVMLLGFGAWLTFATVTQHLTAQGFAVHGDGVTTVRASIGGTVATVDVAAGTAVSAGRRLGTIAEAGGSTTDIVSASNGIVAAVAVRPGSPVTAGTAIMTIDPVSLPAHVVLLVAPTNLPRLHVGQRARVVVGGGAFAATVADISAYPITADELALLAPGQTAAISAGLQPGSHAVTIEIPAAVAGAIPSMTAATAVIDTDGRHPYQFVTGGS